YIRSQVSTISEETRALLSGEVALSVLASDEWIHAKTVLLFNSLPDEIDMSYLFDKAVESSKKVVLPGVKGDELELYYYDPSRITTGSFGILEPTADSDPARPCDIDLAIIPGRAFTATGKRMGRGKGYYDRLLPSLSCPKIGVCYPCQIVEDLPVEKWDIPMDKVIFG
ncbi:MAG: 5-formyltetrahydrofolate cyclo-ligase, partial [Bacteroidales bacterium]|nr:5-formyltetrahydrofolate cyclo-ligase [Bacteroidales bacterium]